VIGAFTFYVSVPHFFDMEEIDLLVEVTNDISFAIESIEMAKKKLEAEEALAQSEERFRKVFEEGPIPIALVNNSFGFLRVNSAFSAMIGYSEVELQALQFKDITHPEHIQGDLENVSRLMNGDLDVYETEKRYVAKNKEIVWAHIKVSVVHDKEGGFLYFIVIVNDITGRKKAEKALKESEEKYHSLMNQAGDAILLADTNGNLLEVNKKAEELLGYTKEELSNINISQIHPNEELERTFANFKEIVQKGSAFLNDGMILRKDGKIVHVDITGSAIEYAGKKVILGIFRDITERKHAEEELRLKQYQLSEAQRITHIGSWGTDFKTGEVTWSDEMYRIYGVSPDTFEVTVEAFVKLIHPDDQAAMLRWIKATFSGKKEPELDFRILLPDGSVRFIRGSGEAFFDETGNLIRTIGTAQDITERKRAELEYKTILSTALDGFYVTDSQGRILDVNDSYCSMTGYSRNELLNMRIKDIEAAETEEIILQRIAKIIKVGWDRFETRHKCKDGRIVDIEASVNYMGVGSGKFFVFMRDVTERKHAEDQIKASLEEKGILLREIHHRVKNNMQIISSLLNLQAGYIEDKKYLEMFKESQNRIYTMSLVHEKLYRSKDFTKINFKDYIHNLANGVFQSYSGMSSNILLNLNIENVELGIDSAIPCGLIINELVTNSLKYAFPDEKKGEIKIVLVNINGNEYELTVSDNGIGIPEDLDFRKTETLGLHLVSSLAEYQLSGKIKLDRSRGTEFSIRFGDGK
jgi:PAS domain S-box-containing protein